MPANINVVDGKAAMAFNLQGGSPWHGLGQSNPGRMTAAEALEDGGLNWEVAKCPMHCTVTEPNNDKTIVNITDAVGIVRLDTHEHLGNVGPKYYVMQNRDAFSFFDNIVGQGQAIYETVGALGRGERIWIMAKLPDEIKLRNGSDIMKLYLLLTSAHDGTGAIKARFTPVRVVCQNTLALALKGKTPSEITIRHTVNADEKLKIAADLMGIIPNQVKETEKVFQKMLNTKVQDSQVKAFLEALYPESDRKATRSQNIRTEIYELFKNGKGNEGKTVWDLYNGTVEFIDHTRSIKGLAVDGGEPVDVRRTRWEASTFGSGWKKKVEAFDASMVLIGN